ncbi:diaminopimelate decarboxylase [Murinocardiopsis flavida]|uniref:Diaminopimelate decarboxylase n=1 Tax=Murinocardiopsis flavida TaxID=645275 RepID=A0A2P8C885_9ACTN|nr:decarboxylase [Murinocardiopsis flavida]PSK81157.1 diaminopimelate decarboxylase [Murinocardiopsis flavida]
MTTDEEFAKQYGSPLYVYDLDLAVAARDALVGALPPGTTLYFSFKANPHPAIARALREAGEHSCAAEISSVGELASAVEAGFAGAEMLYTGPGKTHEEIAVAIDAGVRRFSVESRTDLLRVANEASARNVVVDCLIRVNSAAAGASTGIRMTGAPSQFGFDIERLPDDIRRLGSVSSVRLSGLHLFSLSNARDEAALIAEFEHTIATAAELRDRTGLGIEFLDIGGGFAAPYLTPGARYEYPRLRAALEESLDAHFPQWRSGTPHIACESGRYLTAECGRLICTVVNVKESRGRKFVVLDAGINVLGGMSGLGRLLPTSVGLDGPHRVDLNGDRAHSENITLVGPLCTPGDILGRSVDVHELRPDDVVAIPNAGAYGMTASLTLFLGRPMPTEITVRDGKVTSVSRVHAERNFSYRNNP